MEYAIIFCCVLSMTYLLVGVVIEARTLSLLDDARFYVEGSQLPEYEAGIREAADWAKTEAGIRLGLLAATLFTAAVWIWRWL